MKSFSRSKFYLPRAASSATALILVTLTLPAAQGQDDPAALEDLKNCAQITDATARYACYDRMTSTMRPQANPNNLPVLRMPRATPAVPGPPADSAAPATSSPPVALDAEMEPFVSTVVEVKEREPGKLLVTLENGQVWYQTESRAYPVRAGMEVRLFQGIFGDSWRMSAEQLNSFIQVERVK